METVQIDFLSPIRSITGSKSLELPIGEKETIGTLLSKLIERYGDHFAEVLFDESEQPRRDIIIMCNGENITAKASLGTNVRSGDSIVIMGAVAGG